jgi:membrane-bound serine protease (ClpP class)
MRLRAPGPIWSELVLLLAAPSFRMLAHSWQMPFSPLDLLLEFLGNPNVAYILLVMGLLGWAGEFATGGAVFPGVAGTICLILASVGLLQLPTNWVGAALILAGFVMLVLDIKVAGYGLSVGGAIAFALGSFFLYRPTWEITPVSSNAQVNIWLVLGITAGVTAFFILGISAVVRAHSGPPAMGQETMIGKIGMVRQALAPSGSVHLGGEEWSAVAADGRTIEAGALVRVVGTDGLRLEVERVETSGAVTAG